MSTGQIKATKRVSAISYDFKDELRYKALIDHDLILLKDGCLMTGFRVFGIDLETATPDVVHDVSVTLKDALNVLNETYGVHFITVRTPMNKYPDNLYFTERITTLIDDERRGYFATKGNGYETQSYCFITWEPPLIEVKKKGLKAKIKREKKNIVPSQEQIATFRYVMTSFIEAISQYFSVTQLTDLNFLSVLHLIVNGDQNHGSQIPDIPDNLDILLARDCRPGKDVMIYNNRYTSIVSIDKVPAETYADMLHDLQNLPFEYMWSVRFLPMDYQEAEKHIDKIHDKWYQRQRPIFDQIAKIESTKLNLDAVANAQDALEAKAELESGDYVYGHFTSTFVLRSEIGQNPKLALEQLNQQTQELTKRLARYNFKVITEVLNTEDAFVGSFPGHFYENRRKMLINSLNAAQIMPISSTWTGPAIEPCTYTGFADQPCLMQTGTEGRNPFRLPLHNEEGVGHTLVLGPTGSGKSTLLAMMAAQFNRYENSQVFIFDYGRSMYPLIAAMDHAQYYNLGSENSPALCPLARLETAEDRTFAVEYLERLIGLNGGEITPERDNLIQQTIQTMAQSTTSSHERTLSHFFVNIQDEHLKSSISKYVTDGVYATYLDGAETKIEYATYTAFELSDLMQVGNKVVAPTLEHLFREITRRMDGRPTLIILDEAWLMLNTPAFSSMIFEWLKTLRKANASVVLATQNLADVVNSPIGSAIIDSCKTKILLPNSQINSQEMRKLYSGHLQLNDSEIQLLGRARPKRDYYFTSSLGRRLFSLNLVRGSAQLAFVGMSSKENLKEVAELKEKYGAEWPREWLERHASREAADYWAYDVSRRPQFNFAAEASRNRDLDILKDHFPSCFAEDGTFNFERLKELVYAAS